MNIMVELLLKKFANQEIFLSSANFLITIRFFSVYFFPEDVNIWKANQCAWMFWVRLKRFKLILKHGFIFMMDKMQNAKNKHKMREENRRKSNFTNIWINYFILFYFWKEQRFFIDNGEITLCNSQSFV